MKITKKKCDRMNDNQATSPPSNATEIVFTEAQLDYLRIYSSRKLMEIVNDLGPILMADFGEGVKAAYHARKVEQLLRKHLGLTSNPQTLKPSNLQ